ncbi:MAG: nucleoside deaminase [Bacteroidales bacterium]|nr:nucleoside deaminase [Bacteroidales bacterium]MBN2755699.1 nucleoside deaminase [Bacteroidales bacterium]
MNPNSEFMAEAIRLSKENVENGGGPFGAVIVKDGKIIAKASNSVTKINDPTAHAEINAIREASKVLNSFDLSGCEIYTSCEPCPMCFGAIYWAHLDKIYYGNTKSDAKNIGFDDSFIYQELDLDMDKRKIPAKQLMPNQAIEAFKMWEEKDDKVEY